MKDYIKLLFCLLSTVLLSACCGVKKEINNNDTSATKKQVRPEIINNIKLEFKVNGTPEIVETYAHSIQQMLTGLSSIEDISTISSNGKLTVIVKSNNNLAIQSVVDQFLHKNKEIKQLKK